MAHIPQTEELVFAGLHQGLTQIVQSGFVTLVGQWTEAGHPAALAQFQERLEEVIAVYLAACDVVNELSLNKGE